MKGNIDSVAQVFVSLSFQEFYGGREQQADGVCYNRTFTPPSVSHLRMLISLLKKFQLCHGGILTVLLPECHANQTTWSEVDKDLCDRVRQFILELVLSFGCQAAKALSFTDNLTWSDDGSQHVSPDSLHAHTSFYTQHLRVAGMVPIIEYQDWWNLDLKTRLQRYLDANINKSAKNRSGPWRNLASDSAPDMCFFVKVMFCLSFRQQK